MTTLDDLDGLLGQNNVVVFTTFRRDGMPQQSLVTVGKMDGGLAFTTRSRNAKAYNLARDPRCAIMLVKPDNRGFAVLDGKAEVQGPHNSDAESLRLRLREVYRIAAGKEHPDWDEYDRVMLEQGRVAVLLRPDRIFARNA
ncbi:MAG: TIGR03618 family F420-dependent PPOX class oxidoreductase [Chloroflexi bacterium]|nr:TIGR03618 family F420-dependent PPOX class oxidoreductase [Chloroflexota bacterium]